MKTILLLLATLTLLPAQDPVALDVPANSPLYHQLKIALQGRELEPGSKVAITIAPALETPSSAPPKPANSTFLARSADFSKFTNAQLPDNIVRTATRSGNLPKVRIVALSPSNKATTVRPQPRLWWYQSEDTANRELEFVLSRIDASGNGATLFRRDIPTMKKGYNVIDLSNPAINPSGHKLEPGQLYQWTINHRDGESNSPVFARLTLVENEALNAAVHTLPANPETLSALNAAGNWHELLDTYCTLAARLADEESFVTFRDRLLASAGLLAMTEADAPSSSGNTSGESSR